MLQKKPLQTRNLKIDPRSEQPAEVEDRSSNSNLSLQNRVINNSPDKVATPLEAIDEPNTNALASPDHRSLTSPAVSRQGASDYRMGSTPNPGFLNQVTDGLSEESATLNVNETQMELNEDFQEELEQLENLILDSVRVPLTELVVVDEGLVLEQIESIRKQIPREIAIAINILQRQEEILSKAEEYASSTVESAKKQAERIIQRSTLIRQAELEATRIKIETQRECERMRQEAQKEIEQWQELAISDYENIQNGADDYARNVLGNLEGQLSQMLGIIRNGYQQLEPKTVQNQSINHQ